MLSTPLNLGFSVVTASAGCNVPTAHKKGSRLALNLFTQARAYRAVEM